jgi:hypothetical protein
LEIEAGFVRQFVRNFVLQIVILLSRQITANQPAASANLMAQLSQTSHTGASNQFVLRGWGWCLGSSEFKRETTLAIKAIAARVSLGSSKAVNAKLHRHMQEGANPRKAKPSTAGRRI